MAELPAEQHSPFDAPVQMPLCRPGTALDAAALARGTSIYLVDGVIPMLPRLLCEQLCSLTPGVDHLTFSIVWHLAAVRTSALSHATQSGHDSAVVVLSSLPFVGRRLILVFTICKPRLQAPVLHVLRAQQEHRLFAQTLGCNRSMGMRSGLTLIVGGACRMAASCPSGRAARSSARARSCRTATRRLSSTTACLASRQRGPSMAPTRGSRYALNNIHSGRLTETCKA
jgi:hypothetical protein